VPTITLEGDANGAPHPTAARTRASSWASMLTGSFEGGSATIFRKKRPEAFIAAIVDVDRE
jgi:hypothetical protein